MPLTPDQIKELRYKQETKTLKKPANKRQREIDAIKDKQLAKRPKRLIRVKTQYPQFPRGGPVGRNQTALACTTRGCGLPTWINYKGMPLCNHCIIHALSYEIAELTWRANGNSHDPNDYF